MQAINHFLVIDKLKEAPKKIAGLELTEKQNRDERYLRAKVISVGDLVPIIKKGDIIGYVGNTGISSGPHLHFEIWKGDKSIDPLIYFPEYQKKDLTLKK